MRPHLVVFIAALVAVFAAALPRAQMAPWNNAGLSGPPSGPSGPAPRRDLSGTWDAGFAGVQPTGHIAAIRQAPVVSVSGDAQKLRSH